MTEYSALCTLHSALWFSRGRLIDPDELPAVIAPCASEYTSEHLVMESRGEMGAAGEAG